MKQIPYILTDESLTIVIGGKAQIMNNDHPKWQQANAALEAEEWDKLPSFFTSPIPRPTHEYGIHDFMVGVSSEEELAIINEKAEEGWRVHSFAPDVKDNGGWQKVLFEREVN